MNFRLLVFDAGYSLGLTLAIFILLARTIIGCGDYMALPTLGFKNLSHLPTYK
jgi:hypothetical protein